MQGSVLLDPPAGARGDLLRPTGVREDGVDSVGEAVDVPRWEQPARILVFDDFHHPARGGGDEGCAARHRLEGDHGTTLREAWKDDRVGLAVQRGHRLVRYGPEEATPIPIQSQTVREGPPGFLRPRTGKDQTDGGGAP